LKSQFSLYDLLIIIGITQGIITSILLLKSKKNKPSNRFLALGLIGFCFLSLKPLLHTLNLWNTSFFRFFPNAVEVVLGPLFYFYTIALTRKSFKFSWKKYGWHFIPFIISQTYAFVVYFSALGTSDFSKKDTIGKILKFDLVKDIDDFIGLAMVIIYVALGYKQLMSYKNWLNNTTADSTYPDFKWLRNMLALFFLLACFLVVNYTMDFGFNMKSHTSVHWETFSLFVAFLIYYLGFTGYKQPHYDFNIAPLVQEKQEGNLVQPTSLDQDGINEYKQAIIKALEIDKVYLTPTLNIQEFSKELHLNKRYVSQVINHEFKKSFRDLINTYRVEDIKVRFKNADLKQISLLGLALESGFNSEASFYRIFKKHTGVSPKEYLSKNN